MLEAHEQQCQLCSQMIEPVKLSCTVPLNFCRQRARFLSDTVQAGRSRSMIGGENQGLPSRTAVQDGRTKTAASPIFNTDSHINPVSDIPADCRQVLSEPVLVRASEEDQVFLISGNESDRQHGCTHDDSHGLSACIKEFGGMRFPERGSEEEESSQIMVRQLPFYACLHEDRTSAADRERQSKGYLKRWDTETNRWVLDSKLIAPQRYSIFLRGPMMSSKTNSPVQFMQFIEDGDVAARNNFCRISVAVPNSLNIADIPSSSELWQEVRVDFCVYAVEEARDGFAGLQDHVMGLYFRNEASRLDKWRIHYRNEKGVEGSHELMESYASSMNAAHRIAANHIFHFYNTGLSEFQVDLHHLRVHRFEAEHRLLEAMQRVSSTDVDPQKSEKYLEVKFELYCMLQMDAWD